MKVTEADKYILCILRNERIKLRLKQNYPTPMIGIVSYMRAVY
jgi:hypothetical protein